MAEASLHHHQLNGTTLPTLPSWIKSGGIMLFGFSMSENIFLENTIYLISEKIFLENTIYLISENRFLENIPSMPWVDKPACLTVIWIWRQKERRWHCLALGTSSWYYHWQGSVFPSFSISLLRGVRLFDCSELSQLCFKSVFVLSFSFSNFESKTLWLQWSVQIVLQMGLCPVF